MQATAHQTGYCSYGAFTVYNFCILIFITQMDCENTHTKEYHFKHFAPIQMP